MIMDEWIGAGDAAFIHKARDRMRDRMDGAKIVVLASHNTALLRDVCNKGMIIEGGKLKQVGDIDTVIQAYDATMQGGPR
jgi:ABC-type polysaccharide/polyol phosphate transport system ATPase subunit